MRTLLFAALAALLLSAAASAAPSSPVPPAAPVTPAAPGAAPAAVEEAVAAPQAAPDPALLRYLNIRGYGSGRFSSDGRQLAFNSSVTGTTQKWLMDVNGSFPRQITYFEDFIDFCDFSPHDPGLMMLGVASGGNENTQLYFIRPDGTGLTPFTSNPEVMFNMGDWSRDGRYITYSANLRDRQYFNIHLADLQNGGADQASHRLIFAKDANLFCGPFNPSARVFLVGESLTNFDNNVYLVDRESGAQYLLTPHQGAVRHDGAQWADETTVYFTCDAGREFMGLARMSLPLAATGFSTAPSVAPDYTWVYTPEHDIDSFNISEDGRYIAWVENVDGLGEAHLATLPDLQPLKDAAGNPLPAPAIPIGVQGVGSFDWQSRYLNFGCSGSSGPSNIWRYDLQTGETLKLTESSFGGLDPQTFVDPQVLRFESFDGLPISGIWYEPRGEKPAGGWPVIVDAHGGPEGQARPWFDPRVQLYASKGVAMLKLNPRGSTGYGKKFQTLDDVRLRLNSVADYAAARDWLVEQGLADPARIAITGGSYGGYMVLACLTENPDKWSAGVCEVGIANFVTFLTNTSAYRRSRREAEYGSLEKDSEFLQSISPLNKVDLISAPLLIIHGTNDPRVPVTEAQQMHDALAARGQKVELLVFPDEGHGIGKLSNRAISWQRELDFLKAALQF